MRAEVGEVKDMRVLSDGTLRRRRKVSKTLRFGEQKSHGGLGVIPGVPINVSVRDLWGHLKVHNNTVKRIKRVTRGGEKKEICSSGV